MNRIQTPIFELKNIRVNYGNNTALKIGNFKFHRGTVYGISGPIGCGKSTFLNLLSGRIFPTEGEILYEKDPYKKNWAGKIKLPDDIIICDTKTVLSSISVMQFLNSRFDDRVQELKKQYYSNNTRSQEWKTAIKMLSKGQLQRLALISSIESDPKVLIIDDYGSHLDHETLKDFNKKLSHVARARGATIILASSHPKETISCLSVLLSLDNGHLSKVRSFKRQDQRKSKS